MDAGSSRLTSARKLWSMQCSFVPMILIYLVLLLDWMPSLNLMLEAGAFMMSDLVHIHVGICGRVCPCIFASVCSVNECFTCR